MNPNTDADDGRHDFDPMHGHWIVHHRRLHERLAQCTQWDTFTGTCFMQPLMGGLGNVDDNLISLPESLGGPYRAATLRAFDVKRREWLIWWLDGRYPARVAPPMVGRFEGGQGEFYCDEEMDGRAVRVRFLWLGTRSERPRWEQAFSLDGGVSWETNWEMEFTAGGR